MSDLEPATEPKLAAPGAGLPAVELWIARKLFAWKRRKLDREGVTALMNEEVQEILRLVEGLEPSQLNERQLIKRLKGLEDSSRYWSVYMVLHHLQIVNDSIAAEIGFLGEEKQSDIKVSIADVKPDPGVGEEIVEKFKESCERLLKNASEIKNLNTQATLDHPWFGPLNAEGWYFLSAFHMGIHRNQILKIMEKI